MDIRIKQIRQILDALERVDRADSDTKEIVYDRELAKLGEMDRSGIIEVAKKSIGANARRKRFAPFVFSELYDVPGAEKVFGELLASADAVGRSDIIQTIGLRKLRNLVGVLNYHFYIETDDFCKQNTLHSLGTIADGSSLPIFLELMQESESKHEWAVICATRKFGRPEFRDYLVNVFDSTATKTSHKVMSAWGLAKLGELRAYKYLLSMLDDPEISTENSYDPGHSMRAAQAIADLNNSEFEWDRSSVAIVKGKVADSNDIQATAIE